VPRSWAGLPVHSRFHLGGEALLFVDDQAIAGLNSLQDEHRVLAKAQGEETLHFRAEVVPHGLFGTPTRRPQVELACMLVPDVDLRLSMKISLQRWKRPDITCHPDAGPLPSTWWGRCTVR
jgi:alpha-mannosidase